MLNSFLINALRVVKLLGLFAGCSTMVIAGCVAHFNVPNSIQNSKVKIQKADEGLSGEIMYGRTRVRRNKSNIRELKLDS